MNTRNHQASRRLLLAAAVADAAGTLAAPGAVLVDNAEIVAAGSPQAIGSVAAAVREDHPRAIIIPALANAHTHLDLTHLGPQPFDGDFMTWVEGVRAGRASTPQGVADSVRLGVRLSRAGGVAMVGDISGVRSTVPTNALRESGMGGVSFLEIFGVGQTQSAAMAFLRDAAQSMTAMDRGVQFGVQPHAPYSCGPAVYQAAVQSGLPLATHLAETREELRFVQRGDGPLAEMLKRIGVWDESITAAGKHPIDHVLELLGDRACVAAHLNHVDDRHLPMLGASRIAVAYCPRASAYFGHANHRYRDMLAAGVNVALGTDSMLCLDTPDRISTLDEMRLLHRRDATPALDLLRMATINGARALGMHEALVTLQVGPSAGLISLPIDASPTSASDALSQALARHDPPTWVLGPIRSDNGWIR